MIGLPLVLFVGMLLCVMALATISLFVATGAFAVILGGFVLFMCAATIYPAVRLFESWRRMQLPATPEARL